MVTPPAFGHFIHMLKSLAGGRLAVILEGGYCLQSLSESVAFTLRSLLDDVCTQLKSTEPPQPESVFYESYAYFIMYLSNACLE